MAVLHFGCISQRGRVLLLLEPWAGCPSLGWVSIPGHGSSACSGPLGDFWLSSWEIKMTLIL